MFAIAAGAILYATFNKELVLLLGKCHVMGRYFISGFERSYQKA